MKEVFGRFSLTFSPFIEVWFEETFVELSHASEGCSSVEEIEFFIIFLVHFVCYSVISFT